MIRIALATFAFLAGCCLLAPIAGCGASVITNHARAAQIVAPVLLAAHDAIASGRNRELDICEGLPDLAARELCLDAGIARWAPAVVSYSLAREGYIAWVEGMSIAALAQTPDVEAGALLLPLALALVRLYDGVETALEPFEELDLPDFPGLGLLGGE